MLEREREQSIEEKARSLEEQLNRLKETVNENSASFEVERNDFRMKITSLVGSLPSSYYLLRNLRRNHLKANSRNSMITPS